MPSVGIVSLGCAKNRVDAEMMLYQLNQAGFQLREDPALADAVIVNTRGFIESAKQESIDEILELARTGVAGLGRGTKNVIYINDLRLGAGISDGPEDR